MFDQNDDKYDDAGRMITFDSCIPLVCFFFLRFKDIVLLQVEKKTQS